MTDLRSEIERLAELYRKRDKQARKRAGTIDGSGQAANDFAQGERLAYDHAATDLERALRDTETNEATDEKPKPKYTPADRAPEHAMQNIPYSDGTPSREWEDDIAQPEPDEPRQPTANTVMETIRDYLALNEQQRAVIEAARALYDGYTQEDHTPDYWKIDGVLDYRIYTLFQRVEALEQATLTSDEKP